MEDSKDTPAFGDEDDARLHLQGTTTGLLGIYDNMGMAVEGNTPTASFLTKIGQMQSAGCRLCRTAREARGASTDSLADETHIHINSAGCEGVATTVTAAHHSIWRHLYDSMHAAQKPKRKLKFVMLDKVSNMSTLWRREEVLRICTGKDLAEKA